MNLYETLGVDRDATTADIRRAFRRKALTAHPDTGGDEKEFMALARAHEILINPDRRAHYDQHGEDKPQARTNTKTAQAAQLLAIFLDKALERTSESNGLFSSDYIDTMRRLMIAESNALQKQIDAMNVSISAVRNSVEKTRVGDNTVLIEIMRGKLRQGEAEINARQERIELLALAIEMLEGYQYEPPQAPLPQAYAVYSASSTATR